MALRAALAATGASAETRKTRGVGTKVNPDVGKNVLAAGEIILARASAKPDEARAAGILRATSPRQHAGRARAGAVQEVEHREGIGRW